MDRGVRSRMHLLPLTDDSIFQWLGPSRKYQIATYQGSPRIHRKFRAFEV